MPKRFWKDYFNLSRRERNACVVLLAILAVITAIPWFVPERKIDIRIDEEVQKQLEEWKAKEKNNTNAYAYDSSPGLENSGPATLFYFDPNTLDAAGFRKLGVPEKTTNTLIKYRNKGGHFYKPEDIRKVYGMSEGDAVRLIPFVKIPGSKTKSEQFKTNVKVSPPPRLKSIDINTATSEEWQLFPGIGEVLGNRIVKFRNSIGGFKTVDEVKKTYGLPDSVFQLIKPYLLISDSSEKKQ